MPPAVSVYFALQVVLVPVVLGAALNQGFPRAVRRSAPYAPLVAVAAVVLIVASVMAQNAASVTVAGPRLVGAIIALHTGAPTLQGGPGGAGKPQEVTLKASKIIGIVHS